MTPSPDSVCDLAQVADGLEAVTLRRRGSSPAAPGAVIGHALRRAVTTREAAASDGHYTASDVTWHLPVAELPAAPRLGDVLCDAAGRRWTVLDVAGTTLGSRWRCAARSLAVVYGLDDTISVLQAVYTPGAGGAAVPAWQVWLTGIRARIQPVAAQSDVLHAAWQTVTRYRIFVEQTLSLDHTHRIRGPDGTVYKILGATAAELIGELESIEAEVTPWP